MPSVMNGLAFNDFSTSRSCQSDTCKLSGTCWRSSMYRSTSTALRATAVMCSHLEPCGGKYKLKAHGSGVQLRGLHTVKQSTVVRSLLPPVGDGGSTFGSGNFVDKINDEDYPQYQPQPKPLLNTVQETVAGRLKAEHVPHLMDHVKETCNLTGAAKLVILVNRGQFMTDNLDQVPLGSMLYCLVIRLPESEVWTPVFFGESGVGNRLMRQYMEGNRYFAEYEPNHRRFSMMEILAKPLDIAVQFIEVDKAIRSMCKKLVLQRFDFAFNDKQNGSVRDNPLLQQVSHLPDTNPYLRRELERERNNSLQADVVRKLGQPMYSKTGVV